MGARNDVSVDRLATLRLFDCCTRDELEEIRGISRAVAVEAGRDVCRQGEYEREFFVVNAGQFAVEREKIQFLLVFAPLRLCPAVA